MSEGGLILLLVMIAGLLGQNEVVGLAAGAMLLLNLLDARFVLKLLESHGVDVGVFFLLIGVLLPFATGKLGFKTADTVLSLQGLLVVLVGVMATYLAAKGVDLLTVRPEVMIGLVIGSVLGVAFFDGIPAGPLVAAGIAALLLRILG